MKKSVQLFPIMALSTLLAACGSGKGGNHHEVHRTSSTEIKVDEQGRKIVTTKQTVVEKHRETKVNVAVNPLNLKDKPVIRPVVPFPVNPENNSEEAKPVDSTSQAVGSAAQNAKASAVWKGNFEHSFNAVPVVYLIENDNAKYAEDKNFKVKEQAVIQLNQGQNRGNNHYNFYMFDENAYYGYYRDSADMNNVDNHYVYSFNDSAENKGDLSQLSANYKGKFLYSTRSLPQLVVPSNLELRYQNGVANGQITSHFFGHKLFDVQTSDNARTLELIPQVERLDNSTDELVVRKNSPDRSAIDVHFIHGKDGSENKYLVGQGGNEKYWGVIGAEKQ